MTKLLVLALLGLVAWAMWRGGAERRRSAMSADEARSVLGLERGADAAEVHAAYRRITARVHPDAGGSSDLARRVKIARDVLVNEQRIGVRETR